MKHTFWVIALAAIAAGCSPKPSNDSTGTTADTNAAMSSAADTNAPATTNTSTGMGQASQTVGEGSQRTGNTNNNQLPPSGPK